MSVKNVELMKEFESSLLSKGTTLIRTVKYSDMLRRSSEMPEDMRNLAVYFATMDDVN